MLRSSGSLLLTATHCLLSDHMQVLEKVESGYKNPSPPRCQEAVYQLMTECWLVLPVVYRQKSFDVLMNIFIVTFKNANQPNEGMNQKEKEVFLTT